LRGAASVVALIASIAAGCRAEPASNGAKEEKAPGSAPVEQRLYTATISDPKTFNPLLVVDSASSACIGDVFDTLVRLDPETTLIEPALAERWSSNAAGTEWIFHLRPDARWHDGQPVTAGDVVFTFAAIYDEHVPNSFKHALTVDGRPIRVEEVDAHTVRLLLPRPFAPLLHSLSLPILPKHVLGESLESGRFARQWGIDTPAEHVIGSGPYRMVQYVPAQFVRLRRNPDYWMHDENGAALPYLDEHTLRIVPDQNTAYLKFLAGETDVHNPRPEEVPELRDQQAALGIEVREVGLDTGSLFVTFNRNPAHYAKDGKTDPRLGWFTDRQFLLAIAHSIDKQSMILSCFHGLGRPAIAYISAENRAFHNPQLKDYEYDLDRARAILREAGYVDRDGDGIIEDRNGNEVEFDLNTNAGNQVREKMCSILKEDWAQLGIKVNYRPLDFTLLVEKLDTTFDWDAVLMGFTGGVEPHNAANLLRSSGNLHLWYPNQPSPATEWEAEIDRLLEEGSRELDPERRRPAYWRIQEILHRELPLIQTVAETHYTAFRRRLQNFDPTVWGIYRPELILISE
jgi:peptide/nickel transport system substrate-binding protein